MADLVRVRNVGKKPERIAYNSQVTVINPGQDGFVDREAACAKYGVWWSVVGGRPLDRHQEYLRIRGLYGCFPGAPAGEGSPEWEVVKPRVEIYEMDGKKVSTVVDDPQGTEIPVTERDDEAHMRVVVSEMQEQLKSMQSQLDTKDQIISAGSIDLPPADAPDNAPRRMRRTPVAQPPRLAEGSRDE